ncbi:MAG TPA: exodeoxyribonuclease VII small subunit [Deltaproteobacteria bacterium]|nr:exodeoxyribonuclease VII small subunit [Desulfomonilia bacterium]HDP25563.1 exodeoxyribonuclease VII small subunit [Deltaproteobacteria bacterium]
MKKQKKPYSDMLRELEEILEKMNRGEIPIDELEETVSSAAKTITFLKNRLKSTEAQVIRVLKALEEDDQEGEPE